MQKLFGAYIHWPYCLSKCPYCDFASAATKSINESDLWETYRRDILFFKQTASSQPLTSVFFGGGTPSLMTPDLVNKILSLLEKTYGFCTDIEISLEANPDAIDKDKMRFFRDIGINRLSLGVQSMSESGLKQLGRRHSLTTALTRIQQAQEIFSNINIDLIYARPNQTPDEWEAELQTAIDLKLPHYSCYQLTIEENTPFARRSIQPANDETARTMYLQTHQLMNQHNISQYEVSNYARVGFECRHNMTYWLGNDYLGIGPAAHGRLGLIATQNARTPTLWHQNTPVLEPLTAAERETEKIMMQLRLLKVGYPLQKLSPTGVQQAKQNGWLTVWDNTAYPTMEGILMLNSLILLLIPE